MVVVAETGNRGRRGLVFVLVVVVLGVSEGKVAVSIALLVSVWLFLLHLGLFVEEGRVFHDGSDVAALFSHYLPTSLRLGRQKALAGRAIRPFHIIVKVEVLLIHGGKLLHPRLQVLGRILHLIFSDHHLVVHAEVVVLHLVLVVRRPLHDVACLLLRLRDSRGREHGFLPVVCLFGGIGLEGHVFKCSDGDARSHWLLLHQLSNLERLFVGVAAADERILLAGGGLLAALPAVLFLHDLVVLPYDVFLVDVLKVQGEVLHFLLVLHSVEDQFRGEAFGQIDEVEGC